jgi:hypothetical protein
VNSQKERETDGLRRKKLELSEFASSSRLQVVQSKRQELRHCLDPFKLPKILQDSPSHRALNVGKK